MGRLQRFFNPIMAAFKRLWPAAPKNRAEQLPPDILEKALHEARFLSKTHGVEVQDVRPGEETSTPKRAD